MNNNNNSNGSKDSGVVKISYVIDGVRCDTPVDETSEANMDIDWDDVTEKHENDWKLLYKKNFSNKQ